ncbi:MAG: 2-oxoacid:acceptor oxidoreductase family protein [Lachnospiraceae bacterium]|jgi:2-oxoglutarate ferredoxin oxidoreductase subunit gamma|nr:2-oxoacid:acceptor oxidoreductase family protein [Lachnospiraceae bacterium]MBQ6091992.1 2-oxoacid:acceptor oxidoreductase family protein [Lachnospiraceae bacterium]MBR5369000.1 2-oxoacid:acceptor oxidoreductase family protein [Lachnospiraceae bacterium]
MDKTMNVLLAGFGGQGILFAGKVMAYSGLVDGAEISWLPSYGPEMRGGTCNCSVVLSNDAIGSPLVVNPDVLIAMNKPSLLKFMDNVVSGGTIIVDSSTVDVKVERTDVTVYYVPATKLADEGGLKGLANMILVGKLFKETGFVSQDSLDKGLLKCIPPKKEAMIESNKKALAIGAQQ